MVDINSSPVSLGAGSYDYDALREGLDAAAVAPPENYDQAVSSTLAALDETKLAEVDGRAIDGFHFVDKTREIADGVKVTETIQVFSGGAAAQKAELEEKAAATKGGKGSDK